MRRITKATFKSFVTKNAGNLLIQVNSEFDSMQDCVTQSGNRTFQPAEMGTFPEHSLGIRGVWLVGGSRDYFNTYEDAQMVGIRFSNCCGSGVVAIRKIAQAA